MSKSNLRAEAADLSIICHIHRLEKPIYLQLLARGKFHTEEWQTLPRDKLLQLRAILINRQAARERAALEEKHQLKLF